VSIGPNTIDRTGERPCIPQLYFIAKRLAEGRTPTLRQRIIKALRKLAR
jgi:hypothetical protein